MAKHKVDTPNPETPTIVETVPVDVADAHGVGAATFREIEHAHRYLVRDHNGDVVRQAAPEPTGFVVHQVLVKVEAAEA
ncbi:hypothetical protein OPKNFCMD_4516 [Methylobacterium crusticola]|uniref:Uncharacterized protein n=1 Tax=Methylobacterium crusticola TaxID=1697972 RepID=A0ABQ4R262_9HYPH|nr:hypothetical protein [Methylobacterium crusticola]GJD51758.1 hypothetical protein OPKNFCMD_4516 [Methylobacterium crusticola]